MSEPKKAASRIEVVAPGLFHWTVHDDRIDFRSDAYAFAGEGGTVLVDPLPLSDGALSKLGRISAIVITIQSHQRSAWRLRSALGVKVHAPRGAEGLEERPDAWYGDGERLPGGLVAIHAPGPCDASYALLLPRGNGAGILFIGDILTRGARGALRFVPGEYQDDPAGTRKSARKLAEIAAAIVCPGHGRPVRRGGARAIADALERDAAAS